MRLEDPTYYCMDSMPVNKISVYITSYNQVDYLREAIESVLCQTLRPFEIVIVDDSSNDGSEDLILGYHHKYPELVRYHFNRQNLGVSKTRNIALRKLKGDYITFVDGDDLFEPRKLEVEMKRMEEDKNIDFVYSNFINISSNGNVLWEWHHQSDSDDDAFERSLGFDWPKQTPLRSPLVKRDKWMSIGYYDESLYVFEDLDMMLRLTHGMNTSHVEEVLSCYRRHTEGISSADIERNLQALLYIFKKHKHLLSSLSDSKRKAVTKKMNKFLAQAHLNAAIYSKYNKSGHLPSLMRLFRASMLNLNILFSKKALSILLSHLARSREHEDKTPNETELTNME